MEVGENLVLAALYVEWMRMVSDVSVLFCGQDEGHDKAVKP